jgi:hypothetical protein
MGPVTLETILYFNPLANRLPEEQPRPRRRAAPTGSLARPRRCGADPSPNKTSVTGSSVVEKTPDANP